MSYVEFLNVSTINLPTISSFYSYFHDVCISVLPFSKQRVKLKLAVYMTKLKLVTFCKLKKQD